MIVSDDVGSFPLPEGIECERLREAALKWALGEAGPDEKEIFTSAVSQMMAQKAGSGIDIPTFPQVQDMIAAFAELIESRFNPEEPWVVEKEYAQIPEFLAVDSFARNYLEENKKPLEIRVCVTGPLELYLKRVGLQVEGDLLHNLARSVSRFVENSLISTKYLKTKVVCLDEPSFGLNPSIVVERDSLISAWEAAIKPAHKVDVQIHLHSATCSDLALETKGLDIIGVESAEDPRNLDRIDAKDLESFDKFLRVGVARTNIYSILGDSNSEDPWKNPRAEVARLESAEVIRKRLVRAYKIFGSRIKYAGPDCGLGAWPDQKSAFTLLQNAASAISDFNKKI